MYEFGPDYNRGLYGAETGPVQIMYSILCSYFFNKKFWEICSMLLCVFSYCFSDHIFNIVFDSLWPPFGSVKYWLDVLMIFGMVQYNADSLINFKLTTQYFETGNVADGWNVVDQQAPAPSFETAFTPAGVQYLGADRPDPRIEEYCSKCYVRIFGSSQNSEERFNRWLYSFELDMYSMVIKIHYITSLNLSGSI